MRGVWVAVLGLVTVTGCEGAIGDVPQDHVIYDFVATLAVTPERPVAGRNIIFTLEVTSQSRDLVTTDVILRVLHADGRISHVDTFRGVRFHPQEVWNLTQAYLPGTDDGGEVFHVEVEVADHETQATLWRIEDAATLSL